MPIRLIYSKLFYDINRREHMHVYIYQNDLQTHFFSNRIRCGFCLREKDSNRISRTNCAVLLRCVLVLWLSSLPFLLHKTFTHMFYLIVYFLEAEKKERDATNKRKQFCGLKNGFDAENAERFRDCACWFFDGKWTVRQKLSTNYRNVKRKSFISDNLSLVK